MTGTTDVYVVGVGMSVFGGHEGMSFEDFGEQALRQALADAGLDYSAIGMADTRCRASAAPPAPTFFPRR